ncbi:hypothetical protein HQ35_05115, partial [Porphyromonas cangingivalis]
DSIEITEVPLNAQFAKLPFSETLASLDLDRFAGKGAYTHLIQRKHLKDDSKTLNFFMNVMPDSTMLLSGKELRHSPGLLPLGFSGDVMFFDLSGTIRRKHSYSDGVLTHEYEPIFRDSSLRAIEIERCDWVLSYEYVEIGLPSGDTERRYSNYSYTVHCTTHVIYACLTKDPNSGGGGGGGGRSFTNINIDAPSPEVKMSDEFTSSRYECIYNKLLQCADGKNLVNTIHKRFGREGAVGNLTLTVIPGKFEDSGTFALTEPPATGRLYDIRITCSDEKMKNLSNITCALILMHEMAHAEIHRVLLSLSKGPVIDMHEVWKELLKDRANADGKVSKMKIAPGVYEYYDKFRDELTKEQVQHEILAECFVPFFISTLKTFKEKFLNQTITEEQYEALAWMGLDRTQAFKLLKEKKRKRLKSDLEKFLKDNKAEDCK